MRVLLTGANGNFGSELVRQADFEVVPLNRGEWESLDGKLSQNIDVVIHAASDLHTQVANSPVALLDSNLISTARLLEATLRHRVPRFVFLSSCAVYGEDMRTNEDNQCSPVSINGISKLLNEKLIAEFCTAHGIKFEILRIFNMYGGQDGFSIIRRLELAVETGQPFRLNNWGVAQRDFIHVSDVAAAVVGLLKKSASYTHLNVGTGVATKISTLLDLAVKRFPSLSISHAQTKEAEYSRADISRLRELVDVRFVKIEDYMEYHFMKMTAD